MDNLFTIGFTQKTAETFFESLHKNNVELVLDIRLNNTSQLASFSKYPDIEYFLREINSIKYKHDTAFSPTENTLHRYKKKEINWTEYVKEFNQTMITRNIREYILNNYESENNLCLLCSEVKANQCHRSIVATYFKDVFPNINIVNL